MKSVTLTLQYFEHFDGFPFGQDGWARVHAIVSVTLRCAVASIDGSVRLLRDFSEWTDRSSARRTRSVRRPSGRSRWSHRTALSVPRIVMADRTSRMSVELAITMRLPAVVGHSWHFEDSELPCPDSHDPHRGPE